MVGYKEESESRVYRLYDENSKQILLSRDVKLDETVREATVDAEASTTTRIESRREMLSDSSQQIEERLPEKESRNLRATPSKEGNEGASGTPLLKRNLLLSLLFLDMMLDIAY